MSERLVTGLLFAILLLAPLPLGSNRPLAEALMALVAAISLLAWGYGGKVALAAPHLKHLALPFALTGLWCIAQLFISADRSASLTGLLQLATYAALFIIAVQVGRDHKIARHTLKLIAFSSAFYASYGLAVYALGNDHILWFDKWAYADSLTSTFVNRNAFAAYGGMGLLACVALVAQAIGREDGNLRSVWRNATPTLWLSLWGIIALVLAIILSNSRAGIISIGFGLAALWAGLWLARILPRRALLALAIAGAIVSISAIGIVGERLIQRSTHAEFSKDDRPQIWLATLYMIKDAPLVGHGLNTYDQMFLQYRTPAIKQNYTKAHSTYLEMAADIGIPAALIFFSGFGLIGLYLLRGIHIRRQQQIYPVIALAVLTQATAHSLVDFSFQTPANAALLAVILGVGIAQSFSSQQTA